MSRLITGTRILHRALPPTVDADLNLLGRVVEANRRQPAAIGECPALLSGIDAAMPQQESLQVLTRLA